MATEVKLKWHELSPDMFPKDVQNAIAAARSARQQAAELTANADKLLQGYAGRIAVKVGGTDESPVMAKLLTSELPVMVVSHRFGKLTVAAAPKGEAKASKSKAVLA